MRFLSPRLSLTARLIWSYLIILGTGGLATSMVGSWIVSSTIMKQARRAVDHDFATAKTVYEQQLQSLKLSVEFAASGSAVQHYFTGEPLAGRHAASGGQPCSMGGATRSSCVAEEDSAAIGPFLERIRQDAGFDFLNLTDRQGRVVLRVPAPQHEGGDASTVSVVRAALSGKIAAATEILRDGPPGMALVAAAPVRTASPGTAGVLYGGILLNRNYASSTGFGICFSGATGFRMRTADRSRSSRTTSGFRPTSRRWRGNGRSGRERGARSRMPCCGAAGSGGDARSSCRTGTSANTLPSGTTRAQ